MNILGWSLTGCDGVYGQYKVICILDSVHLWMGENVTQVLSHDSFVCRAAILVFGTVLDRFPPREMALA